MRCGDLSCKHRLENVWVKTLYAAVQGKRRTFPRQDCYRIVRDFFNSRFCSEPTEAKLEFSGSSSSQRVSWTLDIMRRYGRVGMRHGAHLRPTRILRRLYVAEYVGNGYRTPCLLMRDAIAAGSSGQPCDPCSAESPWSRADIRGSLNISTETAMMQHWGDSSWAGTNQ